MYEIYGKINEFNNVVYNFISNRVYFFLKGIFNQSIKMRNRVAKKE